jgi:hypothetical protein
MPLLVRPPAPVADAGRSPGDILHRMWTPNPAGGAADLEGVREEP